MKTNLKTLVAVLALSIGCNGENPNSLNSNSKVSKFCVKDLVRGSTYTEDYTNDKSKFTIKMDYNSDGIIDRLIEYDLKTGRIIKQTWGESHRPEGNVTEFEKTFRDSNDNLYLQISDSNRDGNPESIQEYSGCSNGNLISTSMTDFNSDGVIDQKLTVLSGKSKKRISETIEVNGKEVKKIKYLYDQEGNIIGSREVTKS